MVHKAANGSEANSNSSLWIDPDSGAQHGVLLSDRIAFYAHRLDLIDVFEHNRLGPASYDLTLGSECWYVDHSDNTGEAKRHLAPGETLVLEPNSIVYVTSHETLNLPFYLIGRFNLKLRLLHEGVLVGTGPQIDPGFSGRLSCPLHNLSSSKVSLTCGQSFAVLEFQKTTPFAQSETLAPSMTLADVQRLGEARRLQGLEGNACLTFPAKSLNREPVKRYIPGRLVTSSLQRFQRQIFTLEDSVTRELAESKANLRTFNIGAMIAVATLAIPLALYFATGYYASQSSNAMWHKR